LIELEESDIDSIWDICQVPVRNFDWLSFTPSGRLLRSVRTLRNSIGTSVSAAARNICILVGVLNTNLMQRLLER
jgi:hypothetical protein